MNAVDPIETDDEMPPLPRRRGICHGHGDDPPIEQRLILRAGIAEFRRMLEARYQATRALSTIEDPVPHRLERITAAAKAGFDPTPREYHAVEESEREPGIHKITLDELPERLPPYHPKGGRPKILSDEQTAEILLSQESDYVLALRYRVSSSTIYKLRRAARDAKMQKP